MRKLEVDELETGHTTLMLREHIWFSSVSPKLEAGLKIRKT